MIEIPTVNQNGSQTVTFLDTQLLGNTSERIHI